MKKIIKVIGISSVILFSKAINAQVKYQLTLLPDNKTYVVSLIPSKTWEFPKNLTSTAQVTIKVPSDKPFTAAVTNLIPGVKWVDNSYIEKPESDKSHNYISFGLTTLGTSKIPYVANEEVSLFSFRNIEENPCVGKISLIDNIKDALKGSDAEKYNIGNQISVMATEGDVYEGNLNSDVDCSTYVSSKDLIEDFNISASPIPSEGLINIEWTNLVSANTATQIKIENIEGKVIATRKINAVQGKNIEHFDFTSEPSGCYYFSLLQNNKSSKKYKFLIIK